jgi:hypothetical protein
VQPLAAAKANRCATLWLPGAAGQPDIYAVVAFPSKDMEQRVACRSQGLVVRSETRPQPNKLSSHRLNVVHTGRHL